MSIATAQSNTLQLNRLIKAPRERVFAAWTTPEDIRKWFGPETCRVLSAKVDLRVGGKYSIQVQSSECGEMEVRGVYREVKKPARLVYTWAWTADPASEFPETLVTVDFLERNGFTDVRITHEGLPSDEHREKHSHGWNGCLDKLEQQMAGTAEDQESCATPGTFCWNELLASDTGAASKFYTQLFGWKAEAFPGGMPYTLFKFDGKSVGGLMARPSAEAPPQWLAYVAVENVDASAKRAGELGAKLLMPPKEIPTIGRIAVFQDTQGAVLGLFQPVKA